MDTVSLSPFLVGYLYDHELQWLPFTATDPAAASAKAQACLATQGLQDARIVQILDEEEVANLHEHMVRVRDLLDHGAPPPAECTG